MSGLWVFGYGSLVDPTSFGRTLGRTLRPGIDFFQAEIDGFGRRWNYGIMHSTGVGSDLDGHAVEYTMVALGVVRSPGDSVNGVVGWVEEDELIELDRRERHYDRVEVTQAATVVGAEHLAGSIVLYLPRREAIEYYERARDAGTAAIDQRYWDLVDAAFAAFGAESHARYRSTTPAPDVPVLPLTRT